MYIPVLHARQCERIAILNLAAPIRSANQVRPLCIPVRDDKPGSGSGLRNLGRWIKGLSLEKVPYFILTTPYAPKVPYGQDRVLKLLSQLDTNAMATPVVAITANKPVSTVEDEIKALGAKSQFALLHVQESQDQPNLARLLKKHEARIEWHFFYGDECSSAYYDNWKGSTRALIHDGFQRMTRNADYPDNVDENFSDLAFSYAGKGFKAYGDHTICGEAYTPSGGPAMAIAIHFTFPAPIDTAVYSAIQIRHFVSDHKTKAVGEATRFFEATKKFSAFYLAHKPALSFSKACLELENLNHYPKLMTVKRITIQHHLELMLHLAL